jgi:hypothetical protein
VFLANNRRDHHEIALLEIGPEAAEMQAKQIRVQPKYAHMPHAACAC